MIILPSPLLPLDKGRVLIVREKLLNDHPEIVNKLVEVTERGIRYIHQHPDKAAGIAAQELTIRSGPK